MAKAGNQLEIDTEVRKRREQTELDTLVVYAVNYECQYFVAFAAGRKNDEILSKRNKHSAWEVQSHDRTPNDQTVPRTRSEA